MIALVIIFKKNIKPNSMKMKWKWLEGFQTDHNLTCWSDGDENAFSDEELVSSSFIYDYIFNSDVQEEYFHNEFLNINDV
jgi:hypothetical protein